MGGRQRLVRGSARSRGDAGGPRRVELGRVVARRRGGGVRRRASALTASTANAGSARARRGWRLGSRPISSTSAAPWRWRAAGCGGPGACSIRSSQAPSTAGWPSTRATSPTSPVTPPGRASSRAQAAEAGRRFDVADLEMLGLALEGAALVACAQVDEGMRCLDEATATALAGEATIPISGAWACCFLVTACTAVLDYERAFEWCDRIAEFAERYGSRYMLAFCRAEYGAVHLWRGRWTDAEEMLEASVEDFSRSRPAMVAGPLVGLAELRRRQARAEEAALLLDRAGPSAAAQLCRARLALDRGEARRAVELVERLLRQAPAERKLERAPALEHLVRARVAGVSSRKRARRLSPCGRSSGWSGPSRCAPPPSWSRVCSRLRAASTSGRGRCLRTPSIASSEAARRSRPRRRGSSWPRASPRWVEPTPAEREATTALERLLELGAMAEAERARRLLELSRSRRWRWPRIAGVTRREREVLALLAEGLTNRQIAERLVVSGAHRPSPRHQHPAKARRPLAHGRCRLGAALGRARRRRDIARSGHTRSARKMLGSGEVRAGRRGYGPGNGASGHRSATDDRVGGARQDRGAGRGDRRRGPEERDDEPRGSRTAGRDRSGPRAEGRNPGRVGTR